MKKAIALVLALGMLFAATACAGKKTDDSKVDLMAAVNTALEDGDLREAYDLLKEMDSDQADEMLENFIFVPTWIASSLDEEEVIYDENGYICKCVQTDSDGAQTIWDMENDENGNMIKVTGTDPDGSQDITEYVYDEHNRCIKSTSTENGVQYVREFVYDEDGHCVKEIYNDSQIERTYENGFLMKETSSSVFGEYVTEYVYDEQGKLVKEISDGELSREYVYDDRGNIVKEVRDTNRTIEYAYDADDNFITRNGKKVREWELKYYPNGVPEKIREFSKQQNNVCNLLLF